MEVLTQLSFNPISPNVKQNIRNEDILNKYSTNIDSKLFLSGLQNLIKIVFFTTEVVLEQLYMEDFCDRRQLFTGSASKNSMHIGRKK